jgi:ATP-binding cassette subfamily F protein uup
MKTDCPIYSLQEADLRFGDKIVLKGANVHLYEKDKVCLIGSNGSGKSTLLKLVAEIYEADSCSIFKRPGLKIAYLKQDVVLDEQITANAFVLDSTKCTQYTASTYLRYLGIEECQMISTMSGGQKRRVALASTLAQEADVLLLDEPTNHLDITAIEWLEEYLLKKHRGAIICVSHDRQFLSNLTNKIWWLERTVLRKFDKGFKYFEEWQNDIFTQEETALLKLNRKLDTETKWLQQGVTGRRKRNQRRLENLHKLRLDVKNRIQANATSAINQNQDDDISKTKFIIEIKDVTHGYSNQNLIKNFNYKIIKGEKIGLIGPNGCGKSTLLKILAKEITPKIGTVTHGQNLEIGYLDQTKSTINPEHTLLETLCPNGGHYIKVHDSEMHAGAYLKQFLFDPKLLHTKVSNLSGGQISRLLLAKILAQKSNFLILDEPTNDLDIETLDFLLDHLSNYKGTAIIVSHDRDFLEQLVTRTIILSKEGITETVGGYKSNVVSSKNKNSKQEKDSNKLSSESSEKKQLSYNQKRELALLTKEISDLEKVKQSLEITLLNADLSNTKELADLGLKLNKVIEELEVKMQKWIQLEEQQEQSKS